MFKKLTLLYSFIAIATFPLFSQIGYSSSSVSMNRANGVVKPDQVVVEEYLNYHKHNIKIPGKGQEVVLDIQWDYLENKNLICQVGIATGMISNYSNMPPINTSIIIDKSGSMQSDNRLGKVKKALMKFVKGLRPNDLVSIIAYDSEAEVVLPAQKAGEMAKVKIAIESLQPSGSTNLHAGLMLGYEEVLKNMDGNYINRVILLTDGIANQGITEPEKIVQESFVYNQKGIGISTIGVGSDLNYALLQQLAKKGKGLNHFIGDAEEDITKVFEQELESLLLLVGKNVVLSLDYTKGLALENIYGYSPKLKRNETTDLSFDLKDINRGLTQVFLLEFKVLGKGNRSLKTTLDYFSFRDKKESSVELTQDFTNEKLPDSPNPEIKKNLCIAQMAVKLKEAATELDNKKTKQAITVLQNALLDVAKKYPALEDKDIIRVKDILEKNLHNLQKYDKQLGMKE